MTKYDDATWHSEGDFPEDLPPEAGATHIGMFLAWAWSQGLAGELHTEECPEDLELVTARTATPGQIALRTCDGKLTDEDFNEVGNAFVEFYLESEDAAFLEDYEETLGTELSTLYHVADSWENFDKLKPVIDKRFAKWRS